jgi:molybdopterin synthase catalytic subunit/molybdopterin converting factor small subunit
LCAVSKGSARRVEQEIVMKVGVLFFGVLKDLLGRSSETIDLPDGARVREVVLYYAHSAPRLGQLLPSVAISVNQSYAGMDHRLGEGDEVALLPPVSGGMTEMGEVEDEGGREVRIVRERIDAEEIVQRLRRPGDGALVTFDGVVRNNSRGRRTLYLDYEAYEAMALQQMKSLAKEARARFAVRDVSIFHRLGRLEIGETSVLVVVAAAHRGAAFDACRWIIDTLKKTVPIWKKETFVDGAVWADGEPFPEEIVAAERGGNG